LVWKKINVAYKKVRDFLGFLFNWDFILKYSDSIVTFVNAALEYAEDLVDKADEKVKEFVETTKKLLSERKEPNTVQANSDSTSAYTTSTSEGFHHSVAGNWAFYQLHHGGATEHATVSESANRQDGPWSDVWNDIKDQITAFVTLVKSLADDVENLFKENKCSTSNISKAISDPVIKDLGETVGNIADLILKLIKGLLEAVQKDGNCMIEIPVFSGLWRKITKGRDFTVFRCIALLVAIPASLVHKMWIQCAKNPPDLENKVTKTEYKKFVEGDKSLDLQLFRELLAVAVVPCGFSGLIAVEIWTMGLAFEETGAQDVAEVVSPRKSDILDLLGVNLGALSLILDWPLKYKAYQDIRWTVSSSKSSALNSANSFITYRFGGWKP
jgi:hypothetical protein